MPHSDPYRGDGDWAAVIGVSFWDADDPPGVDFLYDFPEVLRLRSPGEKT